MEKRKLLQVYILIAAGMLIGALAVTQLGWLPDSNANSPEAAETMATNPDIDKELIRKLNTTFVAIAEAANPSVVTIIAERVVQQGQFRNPFRDFFGEGLFDRFFAPRPDTERRLRGLGSGVIVNGERGFVLTSNHVIREADKIRVVLHNGRRIDAEILGKDARTDLAVIKLDEQNLNGIEMGDSDKLHVGEWVLAIGSPLSENLARTVTSGIVSAKGRSNVGLADYEDFIQTDAAINPGNSGGALINLHGELVGINTAIATQSGGFQGIGFAVPINMASKVLDALVNEGKVIRGWLGVMIQEIDQTIANAMDLPSTKGALVSTVNENGPADEAGIASGDVIVEIDGETVEDVTHLRHEVASREPDSRVDLSILRDGERKEIQVTLGQLPENDTTPEMQKTTFDKLGLSVQTLDDQLAARLGYDAGEEGVVITQINQAGAAYSAGLRRGDVIKQINRENVSTASEFNEIIQELDSGDSVLVYAKRQQSTFFAAFELGG